MVVYGHKRGELAIAGYFVVNSFRHLVAIALETGPLEHGA